MTKVYLAGPMRGYAAFHAPAFAEAAAKLRAEGLEVFSPAENSAKLFGKKLWENQTGDEDKLGGDLKTIGRTLFHIDLAYICLQADIVAFLPGWEKSKGATAEHATALALGLPVRYL